MRRGRAEGARKGGENGGREGGGEKGGENGGREGGSPVLKPGGPGLDVQTKIPLKLSVVNVSGSDLSRPSLDLIVVLPNLWSCENLLLSSVPQTV